MEEIPTMYVILILVMLTSFTECGFKKTRVNEGDVAFLKFTYSCDSKEITLQRGNGAPFYSSRNPTTPPPSYKLELKNETEGESCFLYLTINPVLRHDQGGYILFAYKNDPMQIENYRILLLIAYPPGEASCVLSKEYTEEDWCRLHCTAPLGNINGLITCYQDGIKIPTLNSPQQHDETLSQTFLAKIGSLVYCCSSTLNRIKDRCDCKDSVWDPTQNKEVTNVMTPCPPTVPIQHLTFSKFPMEDDYGSSSPNTKATMIISLQPHSNKALLIPEVVVGFLILALIASIAGTVSYFKRRPQMSASSDIESAVRERIFSEEERHLLCEASTNSAYKIVEKRQCEESVSEVSGVKCQKGAERDGYWEWRLVDSIDITDEITFPIIVGCIDECNVIVTDVQKGSKHVTYMIDMNTKHIQRVITGSDTSWVASCALLNGKVVCGNARKTGDSLTERISVYDRQWNLINEVTLPRNKTDDNSWMEVAAYQDGMIIAAKWGQSKIYIINPGDGNIMNTIMCKQNIVMYGVLSSGHIIAQSYPVDHRVFIIDRDGSQREITHSDIILNVCIDPMTDDLYVVTSDDECKTCIIDEVMSGGDMKKRRVASFPLSTRLTEEDHRLIPIAYSHVLMTSSGNMIACDGDNVLIFKKMFSL